MTAEPVIHVIDDDAGVRDSLCLLLESMNYRTRAFESGIALLAAATTLEPGCLLLDVRMPELDGVSVLERLRKDGMTLPVVIMTGHGDVPLAVRAMKAGAADFVEKPFSQETIRETLSRALVSAPRSNGRAPAPEDRSRLAELSPREHEVLLGLVAGLPNKTIAYDLGISPRTVEIHRAHVMEKLGARSLSHLVRIAIAAGLDPDGGATGSSV
jgi:two-component system response regulator FixJ